MSASIACFWIEPAEVARVVLRRFTFGDTKRCPARADWGCDAETPIESVRVPRVWLGDDGERQGGYGAPPRKSKSDPRWPQTCKHCGQPFGQGVIEQRHVEQLWTNGTELWQLRNVPAGAMWNAWWMDDIWPGPDGMCVGVMTPGGEWCIDGPDKDGNRCWRRSGTVPNLTVSPSISMPGYHGHLWDGKLVQC